MTILDTTGPLDTTGHQMFLTALTHRFGPDHAALFATPTPQPPDVTLWTSPGTTAIPFRDVPETTRPEVLRHIGTALSDIRRVAQTEDGPLRTLFPQARRIPSLDCIFIVDNRPVLTQWGLATTAPADPLAPYDDGQLPLLPPPRFPAAPNLLRSALAGTILGLCLAALLIWFMPLSLRCLSFSLPLPPVAPSSEKIPDVPQTAWDDHDLSLMKGCWFRTTNMKNTNIQTGEVLKVRTWTFCFSDDGTHGTQHLTYSDGTSCTGPLSTAFQNNTLVVTAERCRITPTSYKLRSIYRCTRTPDGQADCPAHDADPSYPNTPNEAPGLFQRGTPP